MRSSARENPAGEPGNLKTWYYAPVVGHYVLVTSKYTYDRPSQRRELLAVIPPDGGISAAKRKRIAQSFQKTMEYNKSESAALVLR